MDFTIPPRPSTLAEVRLVLSGEVAEPDRARLIELVQQDPALAAYVLRQVNSAYYGVQRKITQIDRAVSLLGFKNVSSLVLAAALHKAFAPLDTPGARGVYGHILRSSLAAAGFARDLARHLQVAASDTAFAAALLHQVGRLVLLCTAPDQYSMLWKANGSWEALEVPSTQIERSHFETDYLELGTETLQQWELPEEIVAVVAFLRVPEQRVQESLQLMTLVVAVGSAWSNALFVRGESGDPTLQKAHGWLSQLAQMRGMEDHDVAAFLESRREVVRDFARVASSV